MRDGIPCLTKLCARPSSSISNLYSSVVDLPPDCLCTSSHSADDGEFGRFGSVGYTRTIVLATYSKCFKVCSSSKSVWTDATIVLLIDSFLNRAGLSADLHSSASVKSQRIAGPQSSLSSHLTFSLHQKLRYSQPTKKCTN